MCPGSFLKQYISEEYLVPTGPAQILTRIKIVPAPQLAGWSVWTLMGFKKEFFSSSLSRSRKDQTHKIWKKKKLTLTTRRGYAGIQNIGLRRKLSVAKQLWICASSVFYHNTYLVSSIYFLSPTNRQSLENSWPIWSYFASLDFTNWCTARWMTNSEEQMVTDFSCHWRNSDFASISISSSLKFWAIWGWRSCFYCWRLV